MKPVFKVLIVVVIVLVVVHIMKYWQSQSDTFIPWIQQQFETVPPQVQTFAVTPSSLVVNAGLTAVPTGGDPEVSPVLATVQAQPMYVVSAEPQQVLMPVTYVPTTAPSMAVA